MTSATQDRSGLSRRTLLRGGSILGTALLVPVAPSVSAQSVNDRLLELEIDIPRPAQGVANYVPYQVANGFAYIAGQLPRRDGDMLFPGRLPDEVSISQGQQAARQCAINILSALGAACAGDWSRVRQCMRLDAYVASAPDFTGQSSVVNGASDLIVDVFGAAGRHTRTAVGVSELPLNACIEVAAVFAID